MVDFMHTQTAFSQIWAFAVAERIDSILTVGSLRLNMANRKEKQSNLESLGGCFYRGVYSIKAMASGFVMRTFI